MIVIGYLLLLFCIGNIILLFVKDYRARNKFINFLRSENDIKSLQKIGAADSDGQECYRRVSYFSYQEYIIAKYEETGKQEYLDYHNSMWHSAWIFLYVLLIIVSLILIDHQH